MKIFFVLLSLVTIMACGEDNAIVGEDHGNISAGEFGTVLTQDEHVVGWGKSDCFSCHSAANIHQTDRSGTDLNLQAIQTLVEDEGLSGCADCHGTNGVE